MRRFDGVRRIGIAKEKFPDGSKSTFDETDQLPFALTALRKIGDFIGPLNRERIGRKPFAEFLEVKTAIEIGITRFVVEILLGPGLRVLPEFFYLFFCLLRRTCVGILILFVFVFQPAEKKVLRS